MPYRSITYFTDDIHFCMTIWKTLKGVHLWKCFIYTLLYIQSYYFVWIQIEIWKTCTCISYCYIAGTFHPLPVVWYQFIWYVSTTLLYSIWLWPCCMTNIFFFYPCSTYETESWKSIQYMVSITFQHLINNCDLDLWPSDPKIYKNPPLLWPLHVSL